MHDITDPHKGESPDWSTDTDIMDWEIQEAGVEFADAIDHEDLDRAVEAYNILIEWYPDAD